MSLLCTWSWLLLRAPRVAYDRLVADFEALECVRRHRQRREACEAKEEPPDEGGEGGGAQAAEEAAERYLSKMPAAHQTREAVRDGGGSREMCFVCPFYVSLLLVVTLLSLIVRLYYSVPKISVSEHEYCRSRQTAEESDSYSFSLKQYSYKWFHRWYCPIDRASRLTNERTSV